MKKLLTLCLVQEPARLLLGLKKRGFGAGRWNGFGGKVMAGEEIEAATKRELREEAGIEDGILDKLGILEFTFVDNSEIFEVHIFRTTSFSGTPLESEEMRPQWFKIAEIPYTEMWPDDKYWLPLFLAGKKFQGKFRFDKSDVIVEQELTEVKNFNNN